MNGLKKIRSSRVTTYASAQYHCEVCGSYDWGDHRIQCPSCGRIVCSTRKECWDRRTGTCTICSSEIFQKLEKVEELRSQLTSVTARARRFAKKNRELSMKLKSLKTDIKRLDFKDAFEILEYLFLRFHSVVKQLQKRQRKREPFHVKDEYDVQDLLHALLKIYFKDVRPEEYCPSYAGTSARIDFFLKRKQIAIEAKMASKDHGRKKIVEELILDKEYYRKKEGCRILNCLVYDPDERITNPRGFESDLSEKRDNFEVKVFVVPRKA